MRLCKQSPPTFETTSQYLHPHTNSLIFFSSWPKTNRVGDNRRVKCCDHRHICVDISVENLKRGINTFREKWPHFCTLLLGVSGSNYLFVINVQRVTHDLFQKLPMKQRLKSCKVCYLLLSKYCGTLFRIGYCINDKLILKKWITMK